MKKNITKEEVAKRAGIPLDILMQELELHGINPTFTNKSKMISFADVFADDEYFTHLICSDEEIKDGAGETMLFIKCEVESTKDWAYYTDNEDDDILYARIFQEANMNRADKRTWKIFAHAAAEDANVFDFTYKPAKMMEYVRNQQYKFNRK